MNETGRNLMVGTFVIGSLAVLATLMAWFGEVPAWMGGNEWTLNIIGVRELRGLGEGSPVQLNGVEIGRVTSLEFSDAERPASGVVIVAGIKQLYTVPTDAFAKVYGATLGFGTGHIDIVVEPSSNAPPLPREDATIQGEMRSLIGEVITKEMVSATRQTVVNFGNLADAATPVAENLATLLEPRGVGAVDEFGNPIPPNFVTVVERIDRLAANLNTVLGDVDVQEDVRGVTRDLKATTEELKATAEIWRTASSEIAEKLNAGVDRTNENLDRTFVKLNEVLDTLDDGSKSLANVMRHVAEGRGTMGKLVNDDRLYETAVLTLERFADALGSLQAILAKIERDGYVTVGKAPSGLLRKNFPLKTDPSQGN